MGVHFSQDEAFPVIDRLIDQRFQASGDFVTHDEIVSAFLSDSLGKTLIESASEADEQAKSKEWWASNMVQWFSQRFTAEKSEYQSKFERKLVKGAWAYRPIA